MKEFVSLFSMLVVFLILYMYYESKYADVVYTESNIDNKMYLVRNLKDKTQAANLLARIKNKLTTLCNHLRQKEMNNPAIVRLLQRYIPDNISESTPNSKYTSYAINKGEKIVFCLRSRDANENLVEENLLMFVALHELSHVMTKSIGHTQEFWDNFKFLLKYAIDLKLYSKHDFKSKPEEYCGTTITDSPL